jgi:glycerophosphoryl diester phosphodiesterase
VQNKNKILNIAHRGASGHAPENTLSAFRLAIEMKADMIELDLHQTKDRHIVVLHDEYIKKGLFKKRFIRDMTLAEIKAINLLPEPPCLWVSSMLGDERIPTLKEALDLAKGKIRLNLEIKRGSPYYAAIEDNIISLLREEGFLKDAIISSFDLDALKNVRGITSDAVIGFLYDEKDSGDVIKEAKSLSACSFHISRKIMSETIIEDAHRAGLRLFVYTINDISEMRQAIASGVDGIFTDYPDRLADILSHK